MTTHLEERTLAQVVPATPNSGSTKTHSGPVGRLLSQVSKAAEVHAAYRLSRCDRRRISIGRNAPGQVPGLAQAMNSFAAKL